MFQISFPIEFFPFLSFISDFQRFVIDLKNVLEREQSLDPASRRGSAGCGEQEAGHPGLVLAGPGRGRCQCLEDPAAAGDGADVAEVEGQLADATCRPPVDVPAATSGQARTRVVVFGLARLDRDAATTSSTPASRGITLNECDVDQ